MDSDKLLCSKLESLIFKDLGNRGISSCFIPECLYNSAISIINSDKIKPSYILTGFCCMNGTCETDGPLGSVVLCSILKYMKYNTILLTDEYSNKVLSSIRDNNKILIVNDIYQDNNKTLKKEFLEENISFIISCERPALSEKNNMYCTMRAKNISNVTGNLDLLFPVNNNKKKYLTIGIGDGGNEVGTGIIKDKVKINVPMGVEICTNSYCDYLIMAGVSNWGAIALAASLSILSNDKNIGNYMINLIRKQSSMLDIILENGSYDGCSGEKVRKVDGMFCDNEHTLLNKEIIKIIQEKYKL